MNDLQIFIEASIGVVWRASWALSHALSCDEIVVELDTSRIVEWVPIVAENGLVIMIHSSQVQAWYDRASMSTPLHIPLPREVCISVVLMEVIDPSGLVFLAVRWQLLDVIHRVALVAKRFVRESAV
eukprot:CAMPEP_0206432864 /NCGR_PEP_ID=MMETSP0324_2-20121206/8203_1 /ASSEMBLY_ACC=CAM_ASM_000836 /TAXON_ID=2866 /ORGANISM="Crypthecodinium cohnii, Strain Seligo" /LENGTH=126 /DNA_ID=CAMNT_0053899043 /DNA_START=280 /DNA_END=660 /DNA_ORIENTATION=-